MLEDESGRVRLVGKIIEERKITLVTGVIAAVLGAENASGDFEVADICFAGMPPQPRTKKDALSLKKSINGEKGGSSSNKGKGRDDEVEEAGQGKDEEDPYLAIVSGLELGTDEQSSDYKVGMLAEWLLGEMGSDEVGFFLISFLIITYYFRRFSEGKHGGLHVRKDRLI